MLQSDRHDSFLCFVFASIDIFIVSVDFFLIFEDEGSPPMHPGLHIAIRHGSAQYCDRCGAPVCQG